MVDLDTVKHHPAIEEIANILCTRIQNNDHHFFRTISAYFLGVIASTMRAKLHTKDRGEIPVNCYALALSPSGTGKGFCMGIMENEILKGFRNAFVDVTMPVIGEQNMWRMAMQRSAQNATEENHEFQGLKTELETTGAYPFVFDSGTVPAVKQLRQQLLLTGIGSINLHVDEIGSNLIGSTELLNVYLELYDQGLVKPKLTKNTAENKRTKEIEGKTPANMMLFGTPIKLLDGAQTEDHFYSFLETGYARRCLFAFGDPKAASANKSAQEIYNQLTDPATKQNIASWANHFAALADETLYNWDIDVPDNVAIELVQYRIQCEDLARAMPEYEEIRKAEMSHRYFKALKLAGALAFVDQASTLDPYHLHAAMKLVEESGMAFQRVLTREKAYMKLARYIAEVGTEVTHADLDEALPFYKRGNSARNEMLTLATAWGFKQHIMLKKTFMDGIEFFSGETLKQTSLDKIRVSYSEDFAYHYGTEEVPFNQLHKLTQQPGFHWANHGFKNGHRCEENVVPGFNMVVLDIDGGTRLSTAHELLKDFTFMTYTTKRHSEQDHRFRLLIPTNYQLELDRDDYRIFMESLVQWLPFKVDEEANQRSRKWLSNANGSFHYNAGNQLIDVLPFVPKTSKHEQFMEKSSELESLDNLERWFAQRIAQGNRNNQMVKYALALADSGMGYGDVENHVLAFNEKLSNGLAPEELRKTVLVTVAKKLQGTP